MPDSTDAFRRLEAALKETSGKPPLHLWNPELSGDIDIEIDAGGRWFHEGTEFKRHALVRLFASILRKEADGHHYLLTPAEKWRIRVADHALRVVDFERSATTSPQIILRLNTGDSVPLDQDHPLMMQAELPGAEPRPVVKLWHGLTALMVRSAWYRLIEAGESRNGRLLVSSYGCDFDLGALA